MTEQTYVNRRPSRARIRPLNLAGLVLALAGALAMAACQKQALTGRNAELALETLEAAPKHGFPAERFHVRRIEALLDSTNGRDKAQGARELRAAVLDYARAQHGLTIPTGAFPRDWGLKPAAYDAETDLETALQARRLKEWLAEQPPASPAYQALQTAYVRYLKIQAGGGWPVVGAGVLQPMAAGPDVAALRRRLALEDPEFAKTPPNGLVDGALFAAIQRFQSAHGLPATGQLDVATLWELNVPVAGRAAQIRASLERLRWAPRQDEPRRIEANIAAAELDYFAGGKLTRHMLAVSGRPGDETPMLASIIEHIVLNPPWNVPDEIAYEEILPKGAAYLQAKGFAWKDGRLVQHPGPDAALGLVKFDFDNPYGVYLHDTPAKAAFQNTERAVSHGCMRLAQAVDLAKTVLADEPGWSAPRVDAALASGETIHIKLTHPVPVRLVYLTAFPQGDRIAFRPDVYGWDAELLNLLEHPPRAPKAGKPT